MKKKLMLNAKSVSEMLDIPLVTVQRWVHQGKIPCKLKQGEYLFVESEIINWATDHSIRWIDQKKDHRNSKKIHLPEETIQLQKAVKRGGIIRDLKGNDIYSVLLNAVEGLTLPRISDKKMLFEELLKREEIASTGIGKGVAIPHPRKPLNLHLDYPMVVPVFLARPVDFNAVDNQEVFVLFLMLSPTTSIHLTLLSRLSICLQNREFLDLLKNPADNQAIFAGIQKIEEKFAKGS